MLITSGEAVCGLLGPEAQCSDGGGEQEREGEGGAEEGHQPTLCPVHTTKGSTEF